MGTKVYFISGIGADYRFFTHIQLPEGYEAHYIHWIGTRDEVFPLRHTTATHIIPKGGHMFLMSRPHTVNCILAEILPPLQKRTPA